MKHCFKKKIIGETYFEGNQDFSQNHGYEF